MTVPKLVESPDEPEPLSVMADNGTSKPTKATSTRSLLSISYRDLSKSSFTALSRGVPRRDNASDELERQVLSWGGDRPIHSVLVANNGLAAVKFIRSVRSWAYKTFANERAVKLIAMATPEDMKADAEHIRMADQFVEVPGGKNVNNYANVGLIVSVAVRAGVDAVWPGWGHASEFPELPEALEATPSRIRFVGPPAGPMAALGDKVGSTVLAQAAGVPTLAWSGSGVSIDYADCPGGVVPEAIYRRACLASLEETLDCCAKIGYPCMLKASWGGGGKGIRKVQGPEEVRLAYPQVCGEVPGSPIFAMKLAPQSRHLEVQLLCDAHGQVCSLYSRDCSVQRRHQKVVEEGPVTVASAEVLEGMERCARSLARAVGYVGAATVEFLYLVDSHEYCFLELNPRLQVEHPVTEMITGVNIPAAQVLVASGVPLHRIPDIRRLFRTGDGSGAIDFERAARLPPAGHVVAVRVTAENADDGFKPTSGSIEEVSFRSTPDVWGYFSVKSGSSVHEFADSQFGHLFARGDTRDAAVRAMVVALKEIKIRGEIQTPVDYIARMIQSEDFVLNRHHTGWLDARIAAQVGAERPAWWLAVVAGGVLRATQQVNERAAEFLGHLRKGQLPPSEVALTRAVETFVIDGIKYGTQVVRTGPQTCRLALADPETGEAPRAPAVDVVARPLQDGGLLLQVDGSSHIVHSEETALGTRLTIDRATCTLSNEHDPSRLLAVSTGKLVRHLVPEGGHVEADAPYVELEVMKMMMTLLAPAAGRLRWDAGEGAVLAPGMLLATIDLDDPAAVRRATPYEGTLPELGPPSPAYDGLAARYRSVLEAARNLLAGFEGDPATVVADLLDSLDDPALPIVQIDEALAVVGSRLPSELNARLELILAEGAAEIAGVLREADDEDRAEGDEPAATSPSAAAPSPTTIVRRRLTPALRCTARIEEAVRAAVASAPTAEARAALEALVGSLLEIAASHAGGPEGHSRGVARELLVSYLAVEERFETGGSSTTQEVIDDLRTAHADELDRVLAIVMAHQSSAPRAELVTRLLNALVLQAPDAYRPLLRRLAALTSPACRAPAERARRLLERSLLGELRVLVARALSGLNVFGDAALCGLAADESAVALVAELASPRGSGASPASRRSTLTEGLYVGLGNVAAEAAAGLDARVAMLVEAPAAVDDALASLLDHPDPALQRRALATYVKRIYYPRILHEPEIVGIGRCGQLAAVWAAAAPEGSAPVERHGGFVVVPALVDLPEALREVVHLRSQTSMAGIAAGTLHVALTDEGAGALRLDKVQQGAMGAVDVSGFTAAEDAADVAAACARGAAALPDPLVVAASAAAAVAAASVELEAAGYGAVSVLTKRGGLEPLRVVFYRDPGTSAWTLDPVLGGVEPPTAAALELRRLAGRRGAVHVSSRNRQWHIWSVGERAGRRSATLTRAFLRGAVRSLGRPALLSASYAGNAPAVASAAVGELEGTLAGAAAELERLGKGRTGGASPDWAHIFLSVLGPLPLHAECDEPAVAQALTTAAAAIATRHATELRRAAAAQWELRLCCSGARGGAWRVIVSTPTGHEVGEECVEVLREYADGFALRCGGAGVRSPRPLGRRDGAAQAYEPLEPLQQRRLTARRHRTTYAYDFPTVFEDALRGVWLDRAVELGAAGGAGLASALPPPGKLVLAEELVMDTSAMSPASYYQDGAAHISPTTRAPSQNDVGIVAWRLTLATPECPLGRHVVAIANDITFNSGSFGPREDAFFKAATEYALQERLPVVYLAANSGARVGLAEEVKRCLKVEWNSAEDPSKGFKYLYLDEADYESICSRATAATLPLNCTRRTSDAPDRGAGSPAVHYVLHDVVGLEDGLGVECLSGSGAIAGAYARAFREGLTITLVSGRTVGIGAYLARLGRRCIQRLEQPIILTGFAALNKLLGREVYTSQQQLGGPRVMGTNGVSHHVVPDDLAGVRAVLRWLSYAPARVGELPPALPSGDPVARPVRYAPAEGEKLDPRAAVAGVNGGSGDWLSGLFDRGSWTEAQSGWARTVVTGRARLGGVPVGVIAVEVAGVQLQIPADPGMPDSSERTIPQAGQVWFPDSALKTAQAMEEFGLEGLPLFILANWRGFSGGQRDLFEGVLQAGSQIVEMLRTYTRPVTVYLGPGCELRGGAWVVLDSQINPAEIEMYADPSAQGAVLEPQGVVEIKFRAPDLIAAMHRLDPEILRLERDGSPVALGAIRARERELLPVYGQVAQQFARMHDGPARMLAKGVIRGIVPWAAARAFFATRLRRRLAQEALLRQIDAAGRHLSRADALRTLRTWFLTSPVDPFADAMGGSPAKPSAVDATLGALLAQVVLPATGGNDGAEDAWQNDAIFLNWVEAETGASRIALELKALRMQVALESVTQLCQTPEGTSGLIQGLEEAVKSNPALVLRLRSLLK